MEFDGVSEEDALTSTLLKTSSDTSRSSPAMSPKQAFTSHWKYCTRPVYICFFTLFLYGMYSHSVLGDASYMNDESPLQPDTFDAFRGRGSCRFASNFTRPTVPPRGHKVILFWTKFFEQPNPYLHDRLGACQTKKCFLTDDRRYLSQSAAVVFHVRDMSARDLPECRDPRQLYVFFLLESPDHTGVPLNRRPWPGFFNLTWTYRLDSDVFGSLYFDKFQPVIWRNRTAARKMLRGRLDRAVIFSSNCRTPSRREAYIKELQRYFPVDIIGACGLLQCPKSERAECDARAMTYKFYLAFENSICRDYITEKVMRPFSMGTLPIVLGGGNYAAVFPPHSFINTADYPTPKDLADHLHRLTRNISLYERYYDWKYQERYAVPPASLMHPANVSTCRLCEILHNNKFPRKIYRDIHAWWMTQASCQIGPVDFPDAAVTSKSMA